MDFPARAPDELSAFSMADLESRFVWPFCLDMLGTNPLRLSDERRTALIAAGRTATVGDVRSLLRVGAWRNVVMGAWFSLAVAPESIMQDLVAAMSRSAGSLTAPPLAVAASIVAGQAAAPAMAHYLSVIVGPPHRDGSEEIVAAGLELLGADAVVSASDDARRGFRDLSEFAIRLREALHDR
jgi:hypothetical protein